MLLNDHSKQVPVTALTTAVAAAAAAPPESHPLPDSASIWSDSSLDAASQGTPLSEPGTPRRSSAAGAAAPAASAAAAAAGSGSSDDDDDSSVAGWAGGGVQLSAESVAWLAALAESVDGVSSRAAAAQAEQDAELLAASAHGGAAGAREWLRRLPQGRRMAAALQLSLRMAGELREGGPHTSSAVAALAAAGQELDLVACGVLLAMMHGR